jgi:uncharacterized protein YueI
MNAKNLLAVLPTIMYGDTVVTPSESMRWLGVYLDRILSFRTYI